MDEAGEVIETFVSVDDWRSMSCGGGPEAFRMGSGRGGEEGGEFPWGEVTSLGDRNPDAGCAAGKDEVGLNGCAIWSGLKVVVCATTSGDSSDPVDNVV
jgi:hypothetical protein